MYTEDVAERSKLVKRSRSGYSPVGCLSDHMSDREKNKQNGELKVYNWNKPISYSEFRSYPTNIQRECLSHFAEKWGCSRSMFANMLGCNPNTLNGYLYNGDLGGILRRQPTRGNIDRFDAWLSENRTEKTAEEEPKPIPDKKSSVVIPVYKNVFNSGNFEVEGLPSEIGDALFRMFQNTKIHARIDFYVVDEKGEEVTEDGDTQIT